MTIISILGGDFEILFDDETVGANAVAGMRMVRRASGASATVYTTLALYSDVAANADAFQAMGFTNPMLPTTPNEFTMENKYFIPRSSTEWLRQGTIKANWSLTASPDNNGNGIVRKEYTVGMGTDFVAGDIGRQVTESASGDTGTLLDFEVEPDGTLIAWIRPDDSTPTTGDIFDSTTGTISVTGDSGTGTVDVSVAATQGQTQYTAFQAIGSVPTSTEVYVYQDRFKMTDYQGNFQWWTTDPTVSLGIISILLRTQTAGVTIADGDVEVFARRYTSLYDNFRLNVAAGGFAALPLASSPDINNTTGYSTFTGSAGSGTFVAGEEATEAVSGATIVITAVGGTMGAPILEYYLVGDLTDIFSSGAQTVTGSTSGATCTSAAPSANAGGPTETGAGNGATVTIVNGHTTSDHDGDGTPEAYSVTVDAQGPGANGVPVATVYEVIKYRTRRGAPNTDLFGAGVNVPGESYRGAESLVYYDGPTGTMTEGDDLVTDPAGQWSSRLLADNAAAAGADVVQDYIMVTDQQTSLGALANNDVIDDESGDSVVVDTAGAGGAIQTFTSPKASPLGTFTGSQMFGARAVLYTGQADSDTQAYTLTDDLGTLRVSPNTVTFAVANTVAGDRVYAARDTGVAGIIDKDQFGGIAAPAMGYNNQGDVRVRVGTAISTDPEVPDAAWIRIIENTLQQEHHYKYSALDNTDEEFDLYVPTSDTGTITTADAADANGIATLTDTGQLFSSGGNPVEVGMLVRNTFGGKTTHVWEVTEVTDDENLEVVQLYGPGGATQDWDVGDTYEINKLIQAYAATDDIHDLLLDVEATGTTTSNTFIKTAMADFGVVVNVRNGKNILPFTINQTVSDNGATITTVRQPDTIAV